MLDISRFLKKMQSAATAELSVRAAVHDAIKEHVGKDIPIESISASSATIEIKNQSAPLRSAIFIKKARILAAANATQSVRTFTDIR